jgi:hypothetical protein
MKSELSLKPYCAPKSLHKQRCSPVTTLLASVIFLFCGPTLLAYGQTPTKVQDGVSGTIGKGRKNIQRTACIVPVKIRGMNEGELAEVLDDSKNRVAVVRLERLSRPSGNLVATVIVGEEKCSSLAGFTIRPLSLEAGSTRKDSPSNESSILHIAPQYVVYQNSLPGLALNKFLSPGYTQRGFGLRASSFFPREPAQIAKINLQGTSDIHWTSTSTSPSIDLVKDGKVLGMQKLSTQTLKIQAGARILSLNSQLSTEAGAVLYNSFFNKSAIIATGGDSDQLFPAIRDVSGRGFGIYAEQGIIIAGTTRVAVSGGIGFGDSISTPIVEDGESTNTSEKFSIQGAPIFAGLSIYLPIQKWAFTEFNLDFNSMSLQLPLVNGQVTKAQFETLGFSAGVGFRF